MWAITTSITINIFKKVFIPRARGTATVEEADQVHIRTTIDPVLNNDVIRVGGTNAAVARLCVIPRLISAICRKETFEAEPSFSGYINAGPG
ncbi:MAG: hypothetical protein QE485_20980 [Acidovorax sp.]|uniref:hypothetical protein n=1 Tax=Acidovorax sp. TaxID=1872122 RepID=UPI0026202387|nr:hypothetical protein [Acidovorax sp.]MDH4419691.1 hypothetical protein [Acidovorax sp.]